MIKRKDYNVLIERVKIFAQKDPLGYRKRVVLLGILGYAYIFVVLILLISLMIGVGWLMIYHHGVGVLAKVMLFLAVLAWVIFRSLWVNIQPPTGFVLNGKNAPQLFVIIREICARQKSRLPDYVFLNNDFNAFISQVPRFGIFGGYKNYLVLGLPYMMASDLDQFKAVMAHEFGHFSGAHGRIGTWLYRIRTSWYNIMANLGEDKLGSFIFGWFFNLYVPYFNAYSFVLAREHEYEADRYANDYAGAQANAQELINAVIKGSCNSYWQSVEQRIKDEPLPPKDVFTKAVATLKDPIPDQEYRFKLEQALKVRTQNLDTHPALQDRLAALGYKVQGTEIIDRAGKTILCQKPFDRSAAEELLAEETIRKTLDVFDEEWYRNVESSWKEQHAKIQKMKQDISDLELKAQNTPLTKKEMIDRTIIIDELRSPSEAIAAIKDLLDHYPEYAPAHYRLGILLLEQNNEDGVAYLRTAMKLDASLASDCLSRIGWHHESKGNYEQVESVLDNLDHASEKDQSDYKERNFIFGNDILKSHGLSAAVIDDLQRQLQPFAKELKSVYLVQKELKVYPQSPMYVFIVEGKPSGFYWGMTIFNQKLAQKLNAEVTLQIDRGTYLFIVGDSKLTAKVRKIGDSPVFLQKKKVWSWRKIS